MILDAADSEMYALSTPLRPVCVVNMPVITACEG